MNREELLKKWLDNDLNTQEIQAFKELEDYDIHFKETQTEYLGYNPQGVSA